MVRQLLVLALGVSVGMGCLLSNPPDFEEPVDHPPVIVLRDPLSTMVTIDKDGESPTTVFQAVISDGNVDQILPYRWFLDYGPDESPQCGLVRDYLALPSENDDPERTAVYTLDHRLLTTSLSEGQCHRLTLIVTDGQWRDGEHDGCGEVADGSNRALADWWILVYDDLNLSSEASMEDCLHLASQNP